MLQVHAHGHGWGLLRALPTPPGARAVPEGAFPPPGARARRGGAFPSSARSRLDGDSPAPRPRARTGGAAPPGASVRLDGASPRPGAGARAGDAFTTSARARPEGTSTTVASSQSEDASPLVGRQAQPQAWPGGASPGCASPPGSRARLSGASPPNPYARGGATP